MIELEGVSYSYPERSERVLDRLGITIREGEMLLVAGPSGAGKSSFLRTLNGLVPHFHGGRIEGRISVDERDPIDVGPSGMSDRVGFVTQDPETHFVAQYVEDELAFAMENHDLPLGTMHERVTEVLERLALVTLRRRRIETLSGGEKQRVAIGSVLTLRPPILVLDEPTSQLDPESAEDVLAALCRLKNDGMTIVLSEHRLERVTPFVDRVLFLTPGQAPRLGRPAEVLVGSPQAPPLLHLASALGWKDPPLTLDEAARRPELPELRRRLGENRHRKGRHGGLPLQNGTGAGGQAQGPAPTIEARGLHLVFDETPALDGVDLELRSGEILVVMGRNGAGKSTLLKCLIGLLRPEGGTVRLRGHDGEVLDPARHRLAEITRVAGFVPQNPSRLLFHETIEDELRFSVPSGGPSLEPLLADFGLTALRHADPRDVSTGERQRAALAAVLAATPAILLLDEPTRGLDLPNKARLIARLEALRNDGMAVVLATHDVELAARAADRVMVLDRGRVRAVGPARDVLCRIPAFSPQIYRLLGDPRFLTVEDVLAEVEA